MRDFPSRARAEQNCKFILFNPYYIILHFHSTRRLTSRSIIGLLWRQRAITRYKHASSSAEAEKHGLSTTQAHDGAKKYADDVEGEIREGTGGKREVVRLQTFFLSSTSFFFISFAFRTSISTRARRTAGSRHFPTKSSREDFLLIDVETAER